MTTVEASTLNQRAAIASVSMATILLAAKGYAALETGSVAVLGSLADTGLDLLASLVTLWGVRIAGLRADEDHRFGHGKAEALAALFQVVLIGASAIAIAVRAVTALAGGSAPAETGSGIVVSVIAAAATVALLAFQRSIIARTKSMAIGADYVHYQSDLAINVAVIVALVLESRLGWHWADGAFGLAIALWLGFGAVRTGRHAIDQLMDREWPEDKRTAFLEVAARIEEVHDLHDLRTRSSGAHDFAQFHLAFPPGMTITDVHHMMERIEDRFGRAFPDLEVLIHPDPAGHVDVERTLPAEIAERREI